MKLKRFKFRANNFVEVTNQNDMRDFGKIGQVLQNSNDGTYEVNLLYDTQLNLIVPEKAWFIERELRFRPVPLQFTTRLRYHLAVLRTALRHKYRYSKSKRTWFGNFVRFLAFGCDCYGPCECINPEADNWYSRLALSICNITHFA